VRLRWPPHQAQGIDCIMTKHAPEAPPALDLIADVVLAHRPKPKSAAAKKRARRKKKIQRESSVYVPAKA
jgi:hypothetical protein